MLISIVSLKLSSMLAKDMVNSDIAKRTLAFAGKSFIQLNSYVCESIRNQQNSYARLNNDDDDDDDKAQQQKHKCNVFDVSPRSTEYLVHNWLEASFAWFQMVVLWHDPIVSIFTISALFTSFLLLTYLAPRFYATIMIGIFVYNLTKVWFRHVWPEIRVPPANNTDIEAERLDVYRWTYLHPQVITLNELQIIINNLIRFSEYYILRNLLNLRQEKPVNFCILICSILSCTAYIGNRIDGFKLIFSMVLALFTLPGIYLYLLPESLKKTYLQDFSNFFQQLMQQQHVQSIDQEPNSQNRGQKEEEKDVVESEPKTSIFENLKSYNFLTQFASISPSLYALSASSTLSPQAPANTSDDKVPIIHEKVTEEEATDMLVDVPMNFGENKNDSRGSNSSIESSAIRRKRSEDLSSNDESTSLIDLDDDQQDGFVML